MSLSLPRSVFLPKIVGAFAILLLLLGQTLHATDTSASMTIDLMPLPKSLSISPGVFNVDESFSASISGATDPRLVDSLTRMLRLWEKRTGYQFKRTVAGDFDFAPGSAGVSLEVQCSAPNESLPRLGDDESYSLTITASKARLSASTSTGILRGLATLTQLLREQKGRWVLPALSIKDEPRFAWRGLMLDSARHFMPVETVKRQLDAMALVKLNVLHFHLSDDQGFRVESKKFPRLRQLGSDGLYYTHEQIRELVAYAAARGIRVVPEFDVPGHATSILVGYPQLSCEPGPYYITRNWGIFHAVLDPTNEEVYSFLEALFSEMASLFPDDYFHIGGDEVDGLQWSGNARVQQFIKDNKLGNNEGLHAYFNKHLSAIVTAQGKKMMGWNEIMHPDLPKNAVIHVWNSRDFLATAVKEGRQVVLSNGYYIDLMQPAWSHYAVDPSPENVQLTPEEQGRILGGEATMWSEWANPETVEGRIWPRTAAIAERYWSPADITDPADMYRRLAIISSRLEEVGLQHERNRDALLRGLAGERAPKTDVELLDLLIDLVEPVKGYSRGGFYADPSSFTPLTGVVDTARPESVTVWKFGRSVSRFVVDSRGRDQALNQSLRLQLESWHAALSTMKSSMAGMSPRVREMAPLWENLDKACTIGLSALDETSSGVAWSPEQVTKAMDALSAAAKPHKAVQSLVMLHVRSLVACAQEPGSKKSDADWLAFIQTSTTEPKANP